MSQRKRVTALLLDFDGVLRRWDPAVTAGVEREYGLAGGSLHAAAMAPERLTPAVTGQVSDAAWMAGVAEAIAEQAGGVVTARAAVDAWQAYRGDVDPDVLALVREVRAAGVRVGLGTNATDVLDADLAALGLTGEVDLVVNSSVVGAAKPSREFFLAAATALATLPDQVLFVDDDDRAVRGARAAGLSALRWGGPADLPYVRAALAG
ncbi:HAD-IA family hydrolase [Polymorphospora rubra]|uniref:HAD family hydrolase n=1 Tax=Polymorphospora rubra TaxID=338584 RepID=UPI0033EC797F